MIGLLDTLLSILPQFKKIHENVFTTYVKKNNITHKGQYRFREAESTGLVLMELIEEITSNLDNNLVTTGVDLMKASDTIDHSILIKILCQAIASSWIKLSN